MKNDTYKLNFKKLCDTLELGNLLNEPNRITGGLLHMMYKVETQTAVYAIKAINPQIIKRPPAMGHYIFSEKVARLAEKNNIQALPAKVIKDRCIHNIDGQYYMVFDWFEGVQLKGCDIKPVHCKAIGKMLAEIHQLDCSTLIQEEEPNTTSEMIDWQQYLKTSTNQPWHELLKDNLALLMAIEKKTQLATEYIKKETIISHRDLDSKNVLWKGEEPLAIDWEAAGPVNPTVELLEVALSWSTVNSKTDKNHFKQVIQTYKEHGGQLNDALESALNCTNEGMLGWLAYSFRRSLGIECSSMEEQQLGTKEVISTINEILSRNQKVSTYLNWLNV